MAENLQLADLADSLALSRGRKPTENELGNRPADSLEMAIFDEIVRARIRAKNSKFSFPGGPDETMMNKPFPMQSLQRHADPLEEILGIKVSEMRRQFDERERTRAKVREIQETNGYTDIEAMRRRMRKY